MVHWHKQGHYHWHLIVMTTVMVVMIMVVMGNDGSCALALALATELWYRTTEQQCDGGAGGVDVRTFFSLQKAAKSPIAFGLRALASSSFLIFCFASLTLRFSLASLFEPFRSFNFCLAMVFSGPEALPVTWQVVGERHSPHSS